MDFREEFETEWENYQLEQKEMISPTIAVLGISGAGKSSLINTVFGFEIAKVSDVEPLTSGFKLYRGSEYKKPINLIDSAGYEITQGGTYCNNIVRLVNEGIDGENIHVLWYCIPITNKRVEEMDTDNIKALCSSGNIRGRLCVVFTKCDQDNEDGSIAAAFKKKIRTICGEDIKCFETSSSDEMDDQLQLEELISWSASVIDDEDLRVRFISSQMQNLEAKKAAVSTVIKTAAAASAAIGITPIPFSDAALLVPVQVRMITKIIDIYGVSSLASISTALVGDVIITQIGKSVATGILKMIPVVGSLIGGAVNATVAASITTALGYAMSELCYQNVNKYMRGEDVAWDHIFDKDMVVDLVTGFMNKKSELE